MTKDKGISLLSDFVLHTKYARYNKEQSRRETYEEIVDRVFTMHRQKYASSFKSKDLELLTTRAEKHVLDKWVLPSMRSLQFAGEAVPDHRLFSRRFGQLEPAATGGRQQWKTGSFERDNACHVR